ncbi:hypothetical protein GQ457_12G029930 [Hibiscus cannabinus]
MAQLLAWNGQTSALKEGFKKYCRHVISLDGCFLKGSFKGEILSVVGRDSNNQIFPIAWAVVEVENKDSWAWFLKNIQYDLQLGDGEKFTLISDMLKRLLEDVPLWLPNVEYRFCARHMYAILEKKRPITLVQSFIFSSLKNASRGKVNCVLELKRN